MKTFYTWPCLLDLVYIHALTRESFTLIGWEITITQNNPFFPLQTSLWPWKEFMVNKTSTNSKPQYHFSSKYTRSNFSSLTCPRRHISTSFPFISCDRLRGVIRLCEHGPAKTKVINISHITLSTTASLTAHLNSTTWLSSICFQASDCTTSNPHPTQTVRNISMASSGIFRVLQKLITVITITATNISPLVSGC